MRSSPWSTLTVLALAQFMVVLDVTIVNVALPDIQADLGFSSAGLQWVVSAYTLLFGGFLLLGGRAGDLLGRRRMFMSGMALFTGASLVAGLAPSPGVLIAARAAQGLGGALLSPAALSILTVTFAHGRDRNLAMGIWGGLAGLGGTLGVVAGGVLVDAIGWQGVFFVNVPIGIALIATTPLFVRESRAGIDGPRGLNVTGAALGTGGLLTLGVGGVRAGPPGRGGRRGGRHRRASDAGARRDPGRAAGLGGHRGRRAARRRRRPLRRLLRRRIALGRPARAAAPVPHTRPADGEPRPGPERRRVPGHVLPHRDLPAASARRLGPRRRTALPADGLRSHRRRRGRVHPGDSPRHPPGPHRRGPDERGRARGARACQRRQQLHRRHPARTAALRRRDHGRRSREPDHRRGRRPTRRGGGGPPRRQPPPSRRRGAPPPGPSPPRAVP